MKKSIRPDTVALAIILILACVPVPIFGILSVMYVPIAVILIGLGYLTNMVLKMKPAQPQLYRAFWIAFPCAAPAFLYYDEKTSYLSKTFDLGKPILWGNVQSVELHFANLAIITALSVILGSIALAVIPKKHIERIGFRSAALGLIIGTLIFFNFFPITQGYPLNF